MTSSFLDKKPPKSLVQHGLKGSTAVGKDEVGSSNLPSSSKKHRKLRFSVLFCCKNAENGVGQNVGKPPDPHRDPHAALPPTASSCPMGTGKCVERLKEHRRGGFAFSPVFLRLFFAHMTCAMKLPIVCAASSCFCLVAWV